MCGHFITYSVFQNCSLGTYSLPTGSLYFVWVDNTSEQKAFEADVVTTEARIPQQAAGNVLLF